MIARFFTSILAVGALIASLAAATPVEARDHDKAKRFVGTALGLYILHQSLQNNHRRAPAINHNRHSQKKYYDNNRGHRKFDNNRNHRKFDNSRNHRKFDNYGQRKWKQKHSRRDCRQKVRGRDGRWYIVTGRC